MKLQLLDGVVHRQGEDHHSQNPHGVVGDIEADQRRRHSHGRKTAGGVDGQQISVGGQNAEPAQLPAAAAGLAGQKCRSGQQRSEERRVGKECL